MVLLQVNPNTPSEDPEYILIGFGIGLLGFLIYVLIQYYKYRSGSGKSAALKFLKLKPLYKEPLQQYFTYYINLSKKDKVLFEKRVQHFINIKKFIPRSMDEVTPEMKAFIAGAAIQITFGLPKVYFSHFKRILIYPNDYYSVINKKYHKGEVNVRGGIIVLSWNHFVEGYKYEEDSINLGLHEMAHALKLENNIFNKEYGFLDEQVLEQWENLAKQEINNMREGKSDFFRKYAAANQHEFFAIAVENFFERPRRFYEYSPELYKTMSLLLKQNTLKLYESAH